MAHLIAIPIEDRGQAVLIVTRDGNATVIGFVTAAVLSACFKRTLLMDECWTLVERHLSSFEKILVSKAGKEIFADASIACVEIELADLIGAGLADFCRT